MTDGPSNQHPCLFVFSHSVGGNGFASPLVIFPAGFLPNSFTRKNPNIWDSFQSACPVVSSLKNTWQRRQTVASQSITDLTPSSWASGGQSLTGRNPQSFQHFPASSVVPPPPPPLRSSPLLFLKLPIDEQLNSPACVRVWRGEGSIAHRLTNPAAHFRGSTSAEPLPGSPSLVYFSQHFFFLLTDSRCFHNPRSPCLSSQPAPALPLTPFSCTFSVSPAPNSYKTLDSQ